MCGTVAVAAKERKQIWDFIIFRAETKSDVNTQHTHTIFFLAVVWLLFINAVR